MCLANYICCLFADCLCQLDIDGLSGRPVRRTVRVDPCLIDSDIHRLVFVGESLVIRIIRNINLQLSSRTIAFIIHIHRRGHRRVCIENTALDKAAGCFLFFCRIGILDAIAVYSIGRNDFLDRVSISLMRTSTCRKIPVPIGNFTEVDLTGTVGNSGRYHLSCRIQN